VISLWDAAARSGPAVIGELRGRRARIALGELAQGSTLGASLPALRGQSVMIATHDQLLTAIALVELDGVAQRVVLCTPDLSEKQLSEVALAASADAIVVESTAAPLAPDVPARCIMTATPLPVAVERRAGVATEWVLLTSGTSGTPKLVSHTLQTLAGTLPRRTASGSRTVWSTFYDIRRYGGLQIYLRAVMSGAPLVLASPGESTQEFLARAAAAGVTHISGTPSHWRRALMSGDAAKLRPQYVRLSGEVADQALLDALRAAFPGARVAHAFASTEAGVAFEVNDGLAGFPAELLGASGGAADLKVAGGTLHIRSAGNAARYLGEAGNTLAGSDGYVNTGDMVELVDGRYFFRGRLDGVINVGGLKVYPEEIESVLNADPRVRMSRVSARRNPMTGSVVVADVVLIEALDPADPATAQGVRSDLLNACRHALQAHKVPAVLHCVPRLDLTPAGKLGRPCA